MKPNSFASDRTIPFGFFNGETHHAPSVPVNNHASTFSAVNSDLFLSSPHQVDPHQSPYDIFGGIHTGLSDEHRIKQSFLTSEGTLSDAGSGSALHSSSMLSSLSQPLPQQYPQAPYLNGLTHIQSQTPYGPHLPSASATVPMHSVSGNVTNPTQVEEISTIFVVGFPDDMQEREFQNMFTFSPGFEAATLKIPNKESTSYNAPNAAGVRGGSYPQSIGDQYNLAGLSENTRDGISSSWPTEDSHFPPSSTSQPPRKQIIGFAKFRTRQEALDARDVLQGKRVDAEKNAVLKAEMAKKNLHTKRGPVPVNTNLPPIMAPGSAGGVVDSLTSPTIIHPSEPLTTRDRELGAIGAMGLGSRRDRLGDYTDSEDVDRTLGSIRGTRSRPDEDEREKMRRRQESDASQIRSAAYDAFHSVPAQASKSPTQNLSSINGSLPVSSHDPINSLGFNVWGMTAKEVNRRLPIRVALPDLSNHMTSPQASPPKSTGLPSSAHSVESDGSSGIHHSDTLSPPAGTFVLPHQPSFGLRSRPYSPPSFDSGNPLSSTSSSLPSSQTSSDDGNGTAENELARDLGSLSVGSPNSSSPTSMGIIPSNVSAMTRGNPGDQNPPINTLYVGNLPSSPPPAGYPPNYLEEELRELFGRHPGYRKLCFRQKNNGPMCFVEFEDVRHATNALHELQGNTLNGLVKGGGIRLSYSKNPLGVRTPTSATANGMQQQQQALKDLSSVQIGAQYYPSETNMARQPELNGGPLGRRESLQGYPYTHPPAPRFSNSANHYSAAVSQIPTHSSYPRSIQSQFGLDPFVPFRLATASTHQQISEPLGPDDRFSHALTPTVHST